MSQLEVEIPTVSVVIPTYERSTQLRRAIATALGQVDVDLEVVVVDDGSRLPADPRAWSDLQGADRVRLVRQPTRQGPGAARNAGFRAARGRWVAFLDDDDVWAPAKLRGQLDALARTGADFAYCQAIVVTESGRELYRPGCPAAGDFAREIRGENTLLSGPSNVIVRRSLIESLGGFRTDLSFYADWEMWLRLGDAGQAVRVDDVCVGYVDHGASMTRRGNFDLARELSVLMRHHPDLMAREDGPDREHLLRLRASHARAEGRRLAAFRDFLRAARYGRRLSNTAKAGVSLVPGVQQRVDVLRRRYLAQRDRGAGLLSAFADALVVGQARPTAPDWVLSQLRTR